MRANLCETEFGADLHITFNEGGVEKTVMLVFRRNSEHSYQLECSDEFLVDVTDLINRLGDKNHE